MSLQGNSPEDEANICIDCGITSHYSNCSHCNGIICIGCCETNECIVAMSDTAYHAVQTMI